MIDPPRDRLLKYRNTNLGKVHSGVSPVRTIDIMGTLDPFDRYSLANISGPRTGTI